MGVGDEVPAAITRLGAEVVMLEDAELVATSVDQLLAYDTIVIGTRAYAVRDQLRRNNDKLMLYCEQGGNLVVLYNTPEFEPGRWAPYPASLPRNAEEVSEEDAAVAVLQPEHPVMIWPNEIAQSDFAGWVEQRGSKFWAEWDPRYQALVSSHDADQPPQRGGWLHTRYGRGHYTYFAYAIHRQLPFGVSGSYRLLANLISQGIAPDRK